MSKNIKVYCRFRPKNQIEQQEEKNTTPVAEIQYNSLKIQSHEFTFDDIFTETITQQDVFHKAALPIVDDMLKGYNCTLFVYGQTGSGKSWTMSGNEENPGIIPRIVKTIFEHIYNSENTAEFEVYISYIEIYLEKIRDLLNPEEDNLKLRHDGYTNSFWIQDVTEEYIGTMEDALNIVEQGTMNRIVGETRMNKKSSRSHSVFMLNLSQSQNNGETKVNSKLVLVDLAGSEKVRKTGATGLILKQAQATNKSLTTLGIVIKSLNDNSPHIPYRDSKLTRILSDSLGGNSKTALIITCSPSWYNVDETLSTLRFGNRVKNIKNKPKQNVEKSIAEYKRLLSEANRKIKELEKNGGYIDHDINDNDEIDKLQEEIAEKDNIIEKLSDSLEDKINTIDKLNKELEEITSVKDIDSYYKKIADSRKSTIAILENALRYSEKVSEQREKTYIKRLNQLKTLLPQENENIIPSSHRIK